MQNLLGQSEWAVVIKSPLGLVSGRVLFVRRCLVRVQRAGISVCLEKVTNAVFCIALQEIFVLSAVKGDAARPLLCQGQESSASL